MQANGVTDLARIPPAAAGLGVWTASPKPDPVAGLALVAEVGAAIAATTSLHALLATLRRRLKWLLPTAAVSLALDEPGGASYSMLTAEGDETRHENDEGVVGWALRHRMPLDLADVGAQTCLPWGSARPTPFPGKGALLVLPLAIGEPRGGVLVLASPWAGAFAGVDRRLLNLIVLHVAAAVHTALLIAELDGAEAIIAGMARAVEAKDHYTQGHARRVTSYALALADAAALPPHVRDVVAHVAPIHDVGKIGVPDAVLSKPGRLTEEERASINRHPEIGEEICAPLQSLRRLRAGIRHHHERYDGCGYPDGLAGERIPLEARVLAIADAYDAMTSTRPYRQALRPDQARAIIALNEGPQWDPTLAPVFCSLIGGLERRLDAPSLLVS